MSMKNYKNNPGRFDKMIESDLNPMVDDLKSNSDIFEFNINAVMEKPTEKKKSFSYTLKPSLDKKLKKLAKEKGYSNKSSFMSAIIEALPNPKI